MAEIQRTLFPEPEQEGARISRKGCGRGRWRDKRNLIGLEIGKIRVISYHGPHVSITGQKRGHRWDCLCKCGRIFDAHGDDLRRGSPHQCPTCYKPATKPDTYECGGCGVEKPFTPEFFRLDKNRPFGLTQWCIDCWKKDRKERHPAWHQEARIKALWEYSNGTMACGCCGIKVPEFLTFDHLEDDGKHDRAKNGQGLSWLRSIEKRGYPPGIAVACFSCNIARSIYGICPCVSDKPNEMIPARKFRKQILPPDVMPPGCQVHMCPTCQQVFPRTSKYFTRNQNSQGGLRIHCKNCLHARSAPSIQQRHFEQRQRVFLHYGGGKYRCMCCPETRLPMLSLDHIRAGGTRHKKEEKIGSLIDWAEKNGFPDTLQVLCLNCNMAKRDLGSCPCPKHTDRYYPTESIHDLMNRVQTWTDSAE